MVRTDNPPRQKRDLDVAETPLGHSVAPLAPRSLWLAHGQIAARRVIRSGARQHLVFVLIHTPGGDTGLCLDGKLK